MGDILHHMFIKKQRKMKISWKDLNIKEKLASTSACIGFIAGWTLTGIAAFVPLLLSEQAVLWILAQSLTYASAVFGVSMYFTAETRQMRRDLRNYFNEERKKLQLDEEIEDEEQ